MRSLLLRLPVSEPWTPEERCVVVAADSDGMAAWPIEGLVIESTFDLTLVGLRVLVRNRYTDDTTRPPTDGMAVNVSVRGPDGSPRYSAVCDLHIEGEGNDLTQGRA